VKTSTIAGGETVTPEPHAKTAGNEKPWPVTMVCPPSTHATQRTNGREVYRDDRTWKT